MQTASTFRVINPAPGKDGVGQNHQQKEDKRGLAHRP